MKRFLFLLLILLCNNLLAQDKNAAALKTYSLDSLHKDYDLLIQSLKEAHTGLYWYNTYTAFDSIAAVHRSKITEGMNGLEFYQVLAPVIAFTKEGHTALKLSKEHQLYMQANATYLPVYIKIIAGKLYIINDVGTIKLKGKELLSVNGLTADSLLRRFMSYEPSDGYNQTGKYRWIEENGKFNIYLARCYPHEKQFQITFGKSSRKAEKINLAPISYAQLRTSYSAAMKTITGNLPVQPATIKIDSIKHIATLTFNTFSKKRYQAAKMDFHAFVKQAFDSISNAGVLNLIIDIRKNGGGTEGYEDYLLSFMTDKDYVKYQYVQASAFHYSFYPYTDYRSDWKELDSSLRAEHYLEKDGRILRKSGVEEHTKPQAKPYHGKIFVLTGGLTYSGGSEFASLMRNHTNAIFIGEETSGGYYGNTSGYRITLQLPHTQLEIAIPILKFLLATPKQDNPFGRGVMPDYQVEATIDEYLKDADPVMAKALLLIHQR